jgi:hypothetical protein
MTWQSERPIDHSIHALAGQGVFGEAALFTRLVARTWQAALLLVTTTRRHLYRYPCRNDAPRSLLRGPCSAIAAPRSLLRDRCSALAAPRSLLRDRCSAIAAQRSDARL